MAEVEHPVVLNLKGGRTAVYHQMKRVAGPFTSRAEANKARDDYHHRLLNPDQFGEDQDAQ